LCIRVKSNISTIKINNQTALESIDNSIGSIFSKFPLDKSNPISYFKYNNCTITNSTVKTGTIQRRIMAKKLTRDCAGETNGRKISYC
jgi:hypothetical protein